MNLRYISNTYAVDGQIDPSELAEIGTLGFVTVINNRPDGEEPGQPSSAEVEAAAKAAGLAYSHIPMTMPGLTPETVEAHNRAISEADGPVLAFCRSGTRSTLLWALSQVCFHGAAPGTVLSAAADQGYDLSGAEAMLEGYRSAFGN